MASSSFAPVVFAKCIVKLHLNERPQIQNYRIIKYLELEMVDFILFYSIFRKAFWNCGLHALSKKVFILFLFIFIFVKFFFF